MTETGWPTHVDDETGEHMSNSRWSEGVLRKRVEAALPGRAGLRVLCVANVADSRQIDPGTVLAPVTFTDVYGRSLEFPRTGRGYRIRLTDSPVYWKSR